MKVNKGKQRTALFIYITKAAATVLLNKLRNAVIRGMPYNRFRNCRTQPVRLG